MNQVPDTLRQSRQQIVLNTIVELIKKKGFAPTDREIAAFAGLPVTATHVIVHELMEMECITREPKITRSIQVLREHV